VKRSTLLIIILLVIVTVLVVVGVIGKKQGWFGEGKATKVTVEKCSERDIIQTVTANGKIYPEIEVKISSDVSGEVVSLMVEEGDSVQAGQLIAQIKPDTYSSYVEQVEAQKNNTLANLESARARKTQAEVNLANAESVVSKYRRLYADGNASQLELENYEKAYLTAQAEVEAAEQSIKAMEFSVAAANASIKEARNQLDKTAIFSPITGVVSVLNIEAGEKVVGTLQMTGTEMMRIADFEDMEIRVKVSENDIIRVHKGDTAIIEVDAYVDQKFRGVVTSIASSSQGLSGNSFTGTSSTSTNFEVKIRILKSSYSDLLGDFDFPFRPGMSATADIRTKRVKNVLSVPIQAVATRDVHKDSVDLDEKLVEFVFVEEESVARQVVVKTGIQNDTYIEIREGLETGQMIVTAPFNAVSKGLEDGDALQVVTKKELYKSN
jgi:HlyD family secretion protein